MAVQCGDANLVESATSGGIRDVPRDGLMEGFYVLAALYLALMLCLAVRGHLLKQQAKAVGGAEEYLSYHFLAGSSFGPIVIFLNFCAQVRCVRGLYWRVPLTPLLVRSTHSTSVGSS